MSISHNFKQLYFGLLPTIFIPSTILGCVVGINSNISLDSDSNSKPIHYFTNVIGFSGLGMITGITYPISIPLISGYVLYKNIN
jgi:hypothetical protein